MQRKTQFPFTVRKNIRAEQKIRGDLKGVALKFLFKYLFWWSICFKQKKRALKCLVIATLSMNTRAGHFGFSVLAAHLPWPGMASAPAEHYHNKVTHRHYALLPTDRDRGHYQLPQHCLNSRSRLLSGGVVGFWLEGGKKKEFQATGKQGKDTQFYSFNRSVARGEIVAVEVT